MNTLLEVSDLSVSFLTMNGEVKAVRNVSFEVGERETLAIVGESGCGKTVTAKSILKLHSRNGGTIKEGSKIIFEGKNIIEMRKKELNNLRGNSISMIFQDSMTSLNPTTTIGNQISEAICIHKHVRRSEAKKQTIKLLEMVEISDAAERFKAYPHQLSGGMRQRVMIAMALACSPKILIADEPTTALDVTIQAQLLDLLRELKEKVGMSVILVTHDLGVVADFADRIQVMYAGRVVERGAAHEIFHNARHPYTWALLNSIPGEALQHKSKLYSIKGTPPDLRLPLEECPFAARCDYCMPICKKLQPKEKIFTETHSVSCWLTHEMAPFVEAPIRIGGNIHE